MSPIREADLTWTQIRTTLRYSLALAAVLALGSQTSWAWGPDDSATLPVLLYIGASTTHTAQGYLGVDVRDVTSDQAAALKLSQPRGAEIIQVDHDAPAGKAGLHEHDVVLRLNGQPIVSEDQIRRLLRESAPGKTVVLVISRDGQEMTVTTQMANREEVEREAWERHLVVPEPQNPTAPVADVPDSPPAQSAPGSSSPWLRGNSFIGTILMSPAYTGAMLEKMSPQLATFFGAKGSTGLLVRTVESNSPAAMAGMQAGDVVVRADARTVASTSDWAKAIKQSHGHPLAITVLRDKKEQILTLTPDAKKRSSLEPGSELQPGSPALLDSPLVAVFPGPDPSPASPSR
jgi:membrane-associated protease RseP (regulator of RpoE activity)